MLIIASNEATSEFYHNVVMQAVSGWIHDEIVVFKTALQYMLKKCLALSQGAY